MDLINTVNVNLAVRVIIGILRHALRRIIEKCCQKRGRTPACIHSLLNGRSHVLLSASLAEQLLSKH